MVTTSARSSSTQGDRVGAGGPEMRPVPDGRVIALCFGALLVAFLPTLLSFPGTWNRSYHEHGFFVGGLVAWVCWRDRRRFLALANGGSPDLIPVLALLSLGWLFAAIMDIRIGTQALFVLIASAWALAVLGWSARVPVLALGVTATLGLPAWDLTAPILQRATTVMSGIATTAAGIEAEIGATSIAISSGVFLVEEGCAGVNTLMGGLTLGAFYAHLFVPRWQTQLKVVAVAAAAAIVGNWIRVTVLVFLGEATAMQSPYIEDHLWQGWAIFTAMMVPTYLIALKIERRDRRRFGSRDGAPAPDDSDPEPRRRTAPVAATAFAVLGPLVLFLWSTLPENGDLDQDPTVFGLAPEWSLLPDDVGDGWRPAFDGVDERADWRVPVGDGVVHAARHYFVDQRSGEELVQGANAIAPDSAVFVENYVGPVGPMSRVVNEAVVIDGEEPRVVWYWYRVGGFDTPFRSKAKLLEIVAFFRRMDVAELITVSAVCEPESCEAAAALIRLAARGSAGGD